MKARKNGVPEGYTTKPSIHYVTTNSISCRCGRRHLHVWKR